jgi:lysophospholipase L1-like esterase
VARVRHISASAATLLGSALIGSLALSAAAQSPPAVDAARFANLERYAAANAALPAPAKPNTRVVFMGDSITTMWASAQREYFERPDRINRGVSGQTTAQMLLRFRQDVIALKPAVVHILAGINDIADNTGFMSAEVSEANIASMADLAHANCIQVVIGSVLPASDIPWHRGLDPGPKVVALNEWLSRYARAHRMLYVDYYRVLSDGHLGVRKEFSSDGVHPTPEGFRVMMPLAEAALAGALSDQVGASRGRQNCPRRE